MRAPSWNDFAERPGGDVEVRAPSAELAWVLARYRDDLDAAARASAEGRAHGLRALAEQAVLVVRLEQELERSAARFAGRRVDALRDLKDCMLREVRAAGLEIVRFHGANAAHLAGLADVDSWRYDEAYERETVLEELEVAVCHDGVPIRRGRVIMGAPPGGGPRWGDRSASAPAGRAPAPRLDDAGDREPAGTAVACPVPDCGVANDAEDDVCLGCLTHVGGYRRLTLHPRALFNRGLRAARAGDHRIARDCFAAVALWDPDDLESRNAYALACLLSGDPAAASEAWRDVVRRAPGDGLARRGLVLLTG